MSADKVSVNPNVMSQKDGQQLVDAIKAFEQGKEQPEGRFIITGTLQKGG